MRFDILTLFPDMVRAVLGESVIGRARTLGLFGLEVHNIRDYTEDRHRRTDDYPYGGGTGMIMQVQPVKSCFDAVCAEVGDRPYFIYMSPKGRMLTQEVAVELLEKPCIAILCGHYEGIDERIIDLLIDDEISIGDFVLTGGEIPAMALVDSVARMLPGVLKSEESYTGESIFSGLLEYPQYTRPESYLEMDVPEVLLSGHHANIEKWRRERSLEITAARRPDLIEMAELTLDDRIFLAKLRTDGE